MATKFEYSADLDGNLADLHALYHSEDYWRERLEKTGGPEDTLDSFEKSGDEVTIVTTQVIPDEEIPDVARKVLSGSLTIVRTSTYGAYDDSKLTGHATADAAGGLGRIKGSGSAVPTGEGTSRETVSGEIKVSVPLVGGKLEKVSVEYMLSLFKKEYAHINEHLARS